MTTNEWEAQAIENVGEMIAGCDSGCRLNTRATLERHRSNVTNPKKEWRCQIQRQPVLSTQLSMKGKRTFHRKKRDKPLYDSACIDERRSTNDGL